MFKNLLFIFVEKIYKMGCLEGSGVPVLYIGRTGPKVLNRDFLSLCCILYSSVHRLYTIFMIYAFLYCGAQSTAEVTK
jgi:hypothetical protein